MSLGNNISSPEMNFSNPRASIETIFGQNLMNSIHLSLFIFEVPIKMISFNFDPHLIPNSNKDFSFV
jgi:hypothetical protein